VGSGKGQKDLHLESELNKAEGKEEKKKRNNIFTALVYTFV
jgi:hypothetical protein